MTEIRPAGKLDWIALVTLVILAVSTLAWPVVYLNFTLHQIDIRLTVIEAHLGVQRPEIQLGAR